MRRPASAMTRRAFLALAAAMPLASTRAQARLPAIGLHLKTVARELSSDRMGTLKAVAALGYEVVEFHAAYLDWTPEEAREVRSLLDAEGLRCVSTHHDPGGPAPGTLSRAAELNLVLGSRCLVWTNRGDVTTIDGWRTVADEIRAAADTLQALDLFTGVQPDTVEWMPLDGRLPIEVIIANVPPHVRLQIDIGRCLAAGADPVAFMNAHPRRVASLHLRDWEPARDGSGDPPSFGEGIVPWQQVFEMAETRGGAEHYLIARDDHPRGLEAAELDLSAYRAMRGIR